jgi:hypothetical protein
MFQAWKQSDRFYGICAIRSRFTGRNSAADTAVAERAPSKSTVTPPDRASSPLAKSRAMTLSRSRASQRDQQNRLLRKMTARALRAPGIMHEDRIAILRTPYAAAKSSIEKFYNNARVFAAFCEVGLAMFKLTGKADVFNEAMAALRETGGSIRRRAPRKGGEERLDDRPTQVGNRVRARWVATIGVRR